MQVELRGEGSGLKMMKAHADSKRRQHILQYWTVTYVTPNVSFPGLPYCLKVTSASLLRILPKTSVHVATWEGSHVSWLIHHKEHIYPISNHGHQCLPGQSLVRMEHGIFFFLIQV